VQNYIKHKKKRETEELKAIRYYIISLLSFYLYGADISFNSYWLKLLHFKNGVSEIDDKSFFLSPLGDVSPKDELIATLKSIEDSDYRDINSTQCKFPARTRWLKEQFPSKNIKECKYLKEHLRELNFKTLYLVYASSYINAPASMFGHSFLRFDRDNSTPLLSFALNYSAQISKDTNLLLYAYRGLFGGFKGKYIITPYYEMVKIYSNMEERDMWEYRLNLTLKEIEKITLSIIEMQRYQSSYYFTSKNCSYNLLWFIDLAKEDLNLVNEFNYIVTPMDIIKALKRENLITKSIYRPSKRSKIEARFNKIRSKNIAKKFLEKEDISLIKNLKEEEQAKILDLAILKNKPKIETLKYRSQIDIKKSELNITKTNPIKSNLASKLILSSSFIGGRVAYHDIYDIDYDFNKGKYISFFDFLVKKGKLEKLDFIKIDSISPNSGLSSPLSWGLGIGFIDKSFQIEADIGKSYNFLDTLFFLKPSIKLRDRFKFGYRVGFLKSIDKTKIGMVSENGKEFKSFITYQIEENFALHLSNLKKENYLTIFYYF